MLTNSTGGNNMATTDKEEEEELGLQQQQMAELGGGGLFFPSIFVLVGHHLPLHTLGRGVIGLLRSEAQAKD
jgi:hypothetical protein